MPFSLYPINTERLYMLPATLKLYLLELHDRSAFASTLNAHVPEEWPPERIQARNRKLWSFYWVLPRESPEKSVLIGSGGFLAHDNGTLEIGYSLLDAYHGRGYATEAVQSMMQWAFSSLKSDSIVAYTYPHLKASIRVLEKNGFILKGEGPEEGTIAYEFLNEN